MAISYEPELLLARDQGLKLVSIGALVQRPLTSIIALPGKHVTSVADLAGKRVGTAGIPYQAAELRTALEHAGVEPALACAKSTSASTWSPRCSPARSTRRWAASGTTRAIQLRLMHKHPRRDPRRPGRRADLRRARAGRARRRGAHATAQDLRAFLQALTRGEREVRADPAAAAALLVQANPSLEPQAAARIDQADAARRPARAKRASPTAGRARRPGRRSASWMYSHNLLKRDPNIGLPPFTNEFLPGQGI